MTPPGLSAGADLRLLRAAVFTAVCVVLSAAGHALASGVAVPLWALGVGCAAIMAIVAPVAGRERALPSIVLGLIGGQIGLHVLFAYGQSAPYGRGGPAGHEHGGTASGADAVLRLAQQLVCQDHSAPAGGGDLAEGRDLSGGTGSLTAAEAYRIVSEAGLDPSAVAGQDGGGASGLIPCLRLAARAALSLADGPMLLGHLLAALAVGWLLRRGEAALWRLVRLSAGAAEGFVQGAREALRLRALRTALSCVRALCRAGLLACAPARASLPEPPWAAAPTALVLQHAVIRRGPPARPASDLALGIALAA